MRIRAAHVADAPGIAKVQVDSWRTTYAGIVPADYLANLSYEQQGQFWRNIAATLSGPAALYVAEGPAGEIIEFASSGAERTGHPLYMGEL